MKIGFIGFGNMNKAIVRGILNNHFIDATKIYCSNPHLAKFDEIKQDYPINITTDNSEVIKQADIVVLGIKPQMFEQVLSELVPCLNHKKPILVSIAAGIDIATIKNLTNNICSVVRLMPNLNAQINESVSAITADDTINQKDYEYIIKLFQNIGEVYEISEQQFPIFTGIAGCSIAFNLMYVNALATAGLKNGLNKELALKIALNAIKGTMDNLLENKKHPLVMMDEVCSPGGTTIAGVFSLENDAFQASIIKAVEATIKRDGEIKK